MLESKSAICRGEEEAKLIKEELNICGYSKIDFRFPQDSIDWFVNDILRRKSEEIEKHGEDFLCSQGRFDILRNLIRFDPHYLALIESDWLNNLVDGLLDKTAIIHDYFGLLNTVSKDQSLTRNNFHRDVPYLGRRVSIHVMIPLVNTCCENGATQVVPGTHLFENHPSDIFCDKHSKGLEGEAGQVFVMDSSLIHKAGVNLLSAPRPMLVLRYQLAFLKRPIDLCQAHSEHLPSASELVNAAWVGIVEVSA